MRVWEHNPIRTMRNLISSLFTKTTAQNNNTVTSTNSFDKFAAYSEELDTKAVKGGNGEEEEGGDGIIIEDDVIN